MANTLSESIMLQRRQPCISVRHCLCRLSKVHMDGYLQARNREKARKAL